MTEPADKGLLPAGLADILPPDAAHETAVVGRLMAAFASQGYEQIKPPLLEFEEGLLSGAGAALTPQTFRLMDPVSQRMMGLRADMTPQVARIAGSRLRNAPRPLRLCYAGQVLQVSGSQLRPERQFGQVGVELIGAAQEAADAEVVQLAAAALIGAGVQDLSVDLNLPTLVGEVAAEIGFDSGKTADLRRALDGKDSAAVAAIAGDQSGIFLDLLRAAGQAETALAALKSLKLTAAAAAELARLDRVVALIRAAAPDLPLTLDPVEHRGFEYQTGISFIFFARGVRGELGRGGRYAAPRDSGETESSTGFTLFMDTVLRALPKPSRGVRLYLPADHDGAAAARLRQSGWVTVAGFDPVADPVAEALRLGCSHLLAAGEAVALEQEVQSGSGD